MARAAGWRAPVDCSGLFILFFDRAIAGGIVLCGGKIFSETEKIVWSEQLSVREPLGRLDVGE